MSTETKVSKEAYLDTLKTSYKIAALVATMPLEDCLNAANHSDTVAAIFDPTLWMSNHKKLQEDMEVMRALKKLQDLVRPHMTMHGPLEV